MSILLISQILSFLGFWIFLYKKMNTNRVKWFGSEFAEYSILMLSISYFTAHSVRGLIGIYFYYLCDSMKLYFPTILVLGNVLLIYSLRNLQINYKIKKINIIYYPVLLYLFLQFIKVGAPWFEHDESAVYGFLSKAISKGMAYKEIIQYWSSSPHHGPKLIEIIDSIWMQSTQDILFVRFFRWISSILLFLGIVQTLKINKVKDKIAVLIASTAIMIPELASYILISLKVDFMVMCFEVMSMVLLSFGLTQLLNKNENLISIKSSLLLGVWFASTAFACRQSGLYLLLFSFFLVTFAFIKIKEFRKINYWSVFAIIYGIYLIGPVVNIKLFNNPLFPMPAPKLFTNAIFTAPYDYYYQMLRLKPELPFGILHLYLIIHLALGLEIHQIFKFLPHAEWRGVSMIWLSPALLTTYFIPFYYKTLLKNKTTLSYFILFIFMYLFWVHGLHYSRVMLATSLLPVVTIGILISNNQTNTKMIQRIQNLVYLLFLGSLIVGLWISIQTIRKETPVSISDFINRDSRLEFLNTLYIKKYTDFKPYEISDIKLIDNLLEKEVGSKGEVISFSSTGRLQHVFFWNGFFFEDDGIKIQEKAKCGLFEFSSWIPKSTEYKDELFKIYKVSKWADTKGYRELRCKE